MRFTGLMEKMDSSESISFSQDTTTDSIDVTGHFEPRETHKPSNLSPRKQQLQQRNLQREQEQEQPQEQLHQNHSHKQQQLLLQLPDKQRFQRRLTIFESDTHRQEHGQKTRVLNTTTARNMDYHDEDTISDGRLQPDRGFTAVSQTAPPQATPSSSLSTSTSSQNNNNNNNHSPSQNHFCQPASSSASTSSLNTFLTCCSDHAQQVDGDEPQSAGASPLKRSKPATEDLSPGKKSVFFDRVTVYHFNRSQGFSSVPSQGGSTLGMNRKHFLRRRLSVDMFEEVRRRSRRQILLKIKLANRRRERRKQLLQQQQQQQQRLKQGESTPSSSKSDPFERSAVGTRRQGDTQTSDGGLGSTNGATTGETNGDKRVKTIVVDDLGADDDDDEDDDDNEDSYSDLSDISDSELESDSYIFLQPIGVKLRRSLLRESGVCRIDPHEKRDCNKIRDSRQRSGCKCVGQCIPAYCECSRLGVTCHVDRVSFPCGCNSDGCKNPEGRTEFDSRRVRRHFEEKILETYQSSDSRSNDEELLTTPPSSSSTTSEESC